jgi:Arylsulfotransferase (ASST)
MATQGAGDWASLRPMLFLWLAACVTDETTPDGATPDQELTLSCAAAADNALRAVCSVASPDPGPVTLTWGPELDPERESMTLAQGPAEDVRLLWLQARTVHRVTATQAGASATTTVETGELPQEVACIYDVQGTPSVKRLLHEGRCAPNAVAIISSTAGRVEWYQDLAADEPYSEVDMVSMTPEGTVLALGTGNSPELVDWVREFDLYGNLLFEATEFDGRIHHEVTKKNGTYYALLHDDLVYGGRDFLLDGFIVFDSAGDELARWLLRDHIDLTELTLALGPEPIDYSHANSLFVTDEGDVLISFKNIDTLALIRGDWSKPDFGEVIWWLSGKPGGPPARYSDFLVESTAGAKTGFLSQHHAVMVAPNRITVFDNQPPIYSSRLTTLTLDPVAGVADIDQVYTLDRNCFTQGSHYLAAGREVGNCAVTGTVYEFAPGSVEADFTMAVGCFDGEAEGLFRMMPVDEPLAAWANGGRR